MRVRSQKRKEVRMYDQNTGEFIPEAEAQPTMVTPQGIQAQENNLRYCQPQNQYQQPLNGPQVSVFNNIQQVKSNGIGTAGFILALISFLFSWMPDIGWVVWFLGALFSVIGCFKQPRGLAITGAILSFFDLILLISVLGALSTIFH